MAFIIRAHPHREETEETYTSCTFFRAVSCRGPYTEAQVVTVSAKKIETKDERCDLKEGETG